MSTFQDLVGRRFDKLIVLSRGPTRKGNHTTWLCQCDCGKSKVVQASDLKAGNTTSCGCNRSKNRFKDETGNIYGRLTVVKRSENNSYGRVMWECLCECGNTTTTQSIDLRSGNSRSCGCYRYNRKPSGEAAKQAVISGYICGARERGHTFELSKEMLDTLLTGNCFYCGIEPGNISKRPDFNGAFTFNGIDRKNNAVGYTPENCVSCCWVCNRAKGKTSAEDFIAWSKRMSEHMAKQPNP